MNIESNKTAAQFDEATVEQARVRFGYLDAEKQYKIRDLCDVLLPDQSPESAARSIRKEVRQIQESKNLPAPSGQYKFTALEATILSLEIELKWSKRSSKESQVADESVSSAEEELPTTAVEAADSPGLSDETSAMAEREGRQVASDSDDHRTDTADHPADDGKATKRQIRGNVISKSGHKSVVVLVERKVKHPLYKKYIRRSNKLHAHDESDESAVGDVVSIESCRPISKTKCWRVVEIVSHVQ